MSIRKTIRSLDFLGEGVSLTIAGNSAVKTIPGAILTVLAGALFALASGIIIYAFIRTDSPSVTSDVTITTDYPRIDLPKQNLMPILYFYLDEVVPIKATDISNYVTIRFVTYKYYTSTSNTGDQTYNTVKVVMPVTSCGTLMAEKKADLFTPSKESGYIYDTTVQYGLCVNHTDNEAFVQGKISDPLLVSTRLEILPCTDSPTCLPYQEINRLAFILSFGMANIDLSEFTTPLRYISNADDFYFINNRATQMSTVRYMYNSIVDDRGYFIGEKERTGYYSVQSVVYNSPERDKFQIKCKSPEIDSGVCKPYFIYEYMSSGHKRTIVRSYKGFLETLGDIGGTREVIYFIVVLFYGIYNEKQKKKALVAQIYRLYPEKKKSQKCLNFCKKSSSQVSQSSESANSFGDKSTQELEDVRELTNVEDHVDFDKGVEKDLKPAPKEVFNEAYEIVEKSLDAVTIVKQINVLKLITQFILSEYHTKLAPLVALNLDLHETKVLKASKEEEEAELRKHSQNNTLKESGSAENPAHKKISFFKYDNPALLTMDKAYEELRTCTLRQTMFSQQSKNQNSDPNVVQEELLNQENLPVPNENSSQSKPTILTLNQTMAENNPEKELVPKDHFSSESKLVPQESDSSKIESTNPLIRRKILPTEVKDKEPSSGKLKLLSREINNYCFEVLKEAEFNPFDRRKQAFKKASSNNTGTLSLIKKELLEVSFMSMQNELQAPV
jgi:hypothetical protein